MKKLPDLPAWLKPFTADELEQEERRQRRAKRFFGAGGLCERYERTGDALIEFDTIVGLVTASHPDLNAIQLIRLFIISTQLGAFPLPGTGFGRQPDRSVVRGLVDVFNLRAFALGLYALRPSLLTIEAAPLVMRARRTTWVRWLKAQDLPVPPMLAHGLAIDHQSAERSDHPTTPEDTPTLVQDTTEEPHLATTSKLAARPATPEAEQALADTLFDGLEQIPKHPELVQLLVDHGISRDRARALIAARRNTDPRFPRSRGRRGHKNKDDDNF
jgi:hypothetical protein